MEAVICDSSSLIALSDTCHLNIMNMFKSVNFVIPRMVEYESVIRPLQIKQYSLHAHRLRQTIDKGTIKVIEDNNDLIRNVMDVANNTYYKKGKPIHLIDRGESGMIAACSDRDIRYMLIDERTTRTLIEAPDILKQHFEDEFRVHITTNVENLDKFRQMTKDIKILRSSELLILAYNKGYFSSFSNQKDVLEAALYRLKYNGCALSFEEIQEFVGSL